MKLFSFFLFFFLLITSFSCTSALLYMTTCSITNFTTDSDYSFSLSDLASGLVHSSSSMLYANYSNGKAYGMFQCRGDLTNDRCFDCVNASMDIAIRQLCPFSTGANIQQDSCHVQYDDSSAFFNGSNTDSFAVCSTEQNADAEFQSDAESALENVSSSAASMENHYAATRQGSAYAQAQCDGYLTKSQCAACLYQLLTFKKQCNQSIGGRSYYGPCYGRFEDYLFFLPLTPLPPLPASSSSSSNGAIAGGIIGGILFVGLFVSAFLIYLPRRKMRRIE